MFLTRVVVFFLNCTTRLLLLCSQSKYLSSYCKRDDINFDIVNFPFLDGNVPRRPSYDVYIYLNLFALPEYLRMLLN